jgi:hypothetical protein
MVKFKLFQHLNFRWYMVLTVKILWVESIKILVFNLCSPEFIYWQNFSDYLSFKHLSCRFYGILSVFFLFFVVEHNYRSILLAYVRSLLVLKSWVMNFQKNFKQLRVLNLA